MPHRYPAIFHDRSGSGGIEFSATTASPAVVFVPLTGFPILDRVNIGYAAAGTAEIAIPAKLLNKFDGSHFIGANQRKGSDHFGLVLTDLALFLSHDGNIILDENG